jgi:nitroreductase
MFSKLKWRLLAFRAFAGDFLRHVRYAARFRPARAAKDTMRCRILLRNHQLEKAQTYANPKKGYGREKLHDLLSLLEDYVGRFGADTLCAISVGVLRSHFANPAAYKDDACRKRLDSLCEKVKGIVPPEPGGIILHDGLAESSKTDFRSILSGRRSCRQFAPGKLDRAAVREAVLLAMRAPSACNRQMVRVHYYDNPETIRAIVLAQRSDTQWCLDAPALFVITADECYYRDCLERNQRMFDAGLFSMVLDLALHSMGIGSCFKMAQKGSAMDRDTKRIGNIPDQEDICVLILVGGYPHAPIPTAQSPRLPITNILTEHE